MRILKDLSASIADEDVLIVEDIIDTGLTLNYLIRYLRGKGPATLRICTLLDKPARRLVEIPVDYIGFTIPDQFVVGYGLDYGELYRNLRYVGVLKPEVYSGVAGVMTMHRRPLGRGRTLAAIAAAFMVVGCVLPWWQVGGTPGIPAEIGNGLAGRRHRRLPGRDRHPGAGRPAVRRRRPAGRSRSLAVVRAAGGRRLDRLRVAGRRAGPARGVPVQLAGPRSSPTARGLGSRRSAWSSCPGGLRR